MIYIFGSVDSVKIKCMILGVVELGFFFFFVMITEINEHEADAFYYLAT